MGKGDSLVPRLKVKTCLGMRLETKGQPPLTDNAFNLIMHWWRLS